MYNESFLQSLRERLPEFYRTVYGEDPEAGQVHCPNSDHTDNNPSAGMIKGEDGIPRIHCFTCNTAWDVFTLAGMNFQIGEFREQVKKVCEVLGVTLPDDAYRAPTAYPESPWKAPGETRPLLAPAYDFTPEVMKAHAELFTPAGSKTLAYYHDRGLTDETINAYSLGYCPGGLNECLKDKPRLQKRRKPQTPEEAQDPLKRALVQSATVKGYTRLLPNPTDAEGFSYLWHEIEDRSLLTDPRTGQSLGGKYNKLYTKEIDAEIFNERYFKRQTPPRIIVICEGFYDALSIEQTAQTAKAIALIGLGHKRLKALCESNLQALKRSTCFIVALDADSAGQKSAQKVIAILASLGLKWVRSVPAGGKDFNEMLQTDPKGLEDFVSRMEKDAEAALFPIVQMEAARLMGGFLNAIENPIAPIDTGFENLNEVLNGGFTSGLIAIGAISSLGKTTYALQIADQIAEQTDRGCLIFSLEMSANELLARSISRETYLYTQENGLSESAAKGVAGVLQWNRHNHGPDEDRALQAAMSRYKSYSERISIYEPQGQIGTADVRKLAGEYRDYYGAAPVIVIDYLQLIAADDPRDTDKRATDKNVTLLKQLSRDLETPVIVISSFNRANYSTAVSFESFKESGAIEYSADVLIGLQLAGAGSREFDAQKEKAKDPREIEAVILKNRQGKTGIKLLYDYRPKYNYFEEVGLEEAGQ